MLSNKNKHLEHSRDFSPLQGILSQQTLRTYMQIPSRAVALGTGLLLLLSQACLLPVAAQTSTDPSPPQAKYDTKTARSKHGAYLGCFAGRNTTMFDWSSATQLTADTNSKCQSICSGSSMPLYAISSGFLCSCAAVTPPLTAQVSDSYCEQGIAGAVPVFYSHEGEWPATNIR